MSSHDAASEPLDTTSDAWQVQRDVYRRLGGAERISIAFRLGRLARETALAGIRSRHPDYSEAEAQMALRRLVLGDEIVRAVWPGARLLEP
jgi:hypothetical protein